MCRSLDCCSQTEYLLVVLEFSSITDASLSSLCFFLHKWYYHASLEAFKLLSLLISIVGFMENILSSTLVIAIDNGFSILVPLWVMGQFGQIQKLSCFLLIIWWGILFLTILFTFWKSVGRDLGRPRIKVPFLKDKCSQALGRYLQKKTTYTWTEIPLHTPCSKAGSALALLSFLNN